MDRKRKRNLSGAETAFLLLAGLILGTVFVFGMGYWNSPITREQAVEVRGCYDSCRIPRSDGRTKEIILRFWDLEQLSIDGACVTDALEAEISALTPGTRVSMVLHPNSRKILSLEVGEKTLLIFADSIEKLEREAKGFTLLGLACYLGALVGGASLIGKRRGV